MTRRAVSMRRYQSTRHCLVVGLMRGGSCGGGVVVIVVIASIAVAQPRRYRRLRVQFHQRQSQQRLGGGSLRTSTQPRFEHDLP